jgi:hypothetical protein
MPCAHSSLVVRASLAGVLSLFWGAYRGVLLTSIAIWMDCSASATGHLPESFGFFFWLPPLYALARSDHPIKQWHSSVQMSTGTLDCSKYCNYRSKARLEL